VARLGSGWLPGAGTTPEKIASGLERLKEILAEEGIARREFSTVVQLDLHLAGTRAAALKNGAEWYAQFQGQIIQNKSFETIVDGGAFGTAEVCAEKIAAYAAVGAEAVILRFFATDWLAQFEIFRQEVFPAFAGDIETAG
jgi:alkanesulfonate monooxygenase SsuD/methylene tetrahydromethanopterin reductase-like flavin-dependent oxidoreductase (luciferase family)